MNRLRALEQIMPPNTTRTSEWARRAAGAARKHQRVTPKMTRSRSSGIGRESRLRQRAAPLADRYAAARKLVGRTRRIRIAVLARQADQHDVADLREHVRHHAARRSLSPDERAQQRQRKPPAGCINGSANDSYCAASTRNTNTMPSAKISAAALPPSICSSDIPLHS